MNVSHPALVAATLFAGVSVVSAQVDTDSRPGAVEAGLPDRAIDPVHRGLLEFAFEATILMPLDPHLVDRCMLQEDIALQCITSSQYGLAATFADQINDWRSGVIHAELAKACADQQLEKQALEYCKRAERAAAGVQSSADGQLWQSDRIRSRVAIAQKRLGRLDDAVNAARQVKSGQTVAFEVEVAETLDDAAFEAQLEAMDGALQAGGMQEAMNLSEIGLVLLRRYYEQPARRERILERVERAAKNMPAMAAIELQTRVAGITAESGDRTNARAIVARMRDRLATFRMHEEDMMGVRAQVARALFDVGAREEAIDELHATLAFYKEHEDEILDMFRADGLVPVAAAFHHCGSEPAAVSTYRRAIDNARLNPNARPRLQDLVLIVVSMVECGFEPSVAMRRQLQAMRAGLTDPW